MRRERIVLLLHQPAQSTKPTFPLRRDVREQAAGILQPSGLELEETLPAPPTAVDQPRLFEDPHMLAHRLSRDPGAFGEQCD